MAVTIYKYSVSTKNFVYYDFFYTFARLYAYIASKALCISKFASNNK